MQQQEVIAYTIPVTRQGQKAYFQIRMPHNLRRIIGVEWGMLPDQGERGLPPSPIDPHFQFQPNELFGKLVLQAPGCGGIFYQDDLVKDKNIHLDENIGFRNWTPALWTHNRKKAEWELSLPHTDFVEGYFWNQRTDDDAYFVHIYLWIEKTAA
ncbi:hypothetical protein [Puia dinghuensis]|uniref:Uncharacterized protein n=1 Tax=Puia dinghuensis TaxID=1792502 RepID=A0A8J2XRP9_9BACT|nr:hypothetical protein [Puia dinghuensis]GGA89969.1 hypothetical protein GCM10011511_11520 [Puia dinghuensis]